MRRFSGEDPLSESRWRCDDRRASGMRSSACWVVLRVDSEHTGAGGELRKRLLALSGLGARGVVLDVSRCGGVPPGQLYVLGQLLEPLSTVGGGGLEVRLWADSFPLRRSLRDSGLASRLPMVDSLRRALEHPAPDPTEEAVFLTYALSRPGGTEREHECLARIAELLLASVPVDVGQVDGYDILSGQAVVYLYGPDCERLWSCLQQLAYVRELPLVDVELRFGGFDADHVHLAPSSQAGLPVCGENS